MSNIDEKISALFDGELSNEEADEVLEILDGNKNLQAKLSKYALISSAFAQDSNNLQAISSKQNSFKYDLYGICNHSGGSAGGHYTAYVKNANDKWYLFNDTNVDEVNLGKLKSPEAYCFFYRKQKK